jgi:hypothetical protein
LIVFEKWVHHEWLSCLAGTEPIDDVHWIIPGKGQFPLQLAGYLQYLVVAPPGSAGIGDADMLVNVTYLDLHKHILSGIFMPSLGKQRQLNVVLLVNGTPQPDCFLNTGGCPVGLRRVFPWHTCRAGI